MLIYIYLKKKKWKTMQLSPGTEPFNFLITSLHSLNKPILNNERENGILKIIIL